MQHALAHSVFPPTIEVALNRFLAMNPDAIPLCRALDGQVVAIEPREVGLPLFFLPTDDRIQVSGEYDGEADALLRGSAFDFARARFSDGGWLDADIQVDGDVDTARRFSELLQAIDFDWEEPLSRVVGDVAAHQVGQAARSLFAFGRGLFEQTATRAVDRGELAGKQEVDVFCDDVDAFRDDVERLDARINHLAARQAC